MSQIACPKTCSMGVSTDNSSGPSYTASNIFSVLFFILERSCPPPVVLCFLASPAFPCCFHSTRTKLILISPNAKLVPEHPCVSPCFCCAVLGHGRAQLFCWRGKLKALPSVVILALPVVSLRSTQGWSEGRSPHIWHLQLTKKCL